MEAADVAERAMKKHIKREDHGLKLLVNYRIANHCEVREVREVSEAKRR